MLSPRLRIAALFAAALFPLLELGAQQEGYINIEIINDSHSDRRIRVVDNICELMVLERRLVGDGMIPAQVCSRRMGRGDITIVNLETGAEKRYQNFLGGDRLTAP
jgi:hypothetical protein